MELKHFFAQDIEGNVIPNATVYVYEAGTTTIATALEDKDGNPLPVPFYANEDGLIQFAAPNGVYDLRVVSGLRDYVLQVQVFDVQDGSSLPVTASGSSSPRPLTERFSDVANVRDFGAIGDGVKDDTAAVQAALDTAASHVYFPEGRYRIVDALEDGTPALTSTLADRKISGPGVITATSRVLKALEVTGTRSEISLHIDGNGYIAHGIEVKAVNVSVHDCLIHNLFAENYSGIGIVVNLDGLQGGGKITNNRIYDISATDDGSPGNGVGICRGIAISADADQRDAVMVQGNQIINVTGEEGNGIAVLCSDGAGTYFELPVIISGNEIVKFGRRAIKVQSHGAYIANNVLRNTYTTLAEIPGTGPMSVIDLVQGGRHTVIANRLIDCKCFGQISIVSEGPEEIVDDVAIIGNIITGVGGETTNKSSIIFCSTRGDRLNISNNIIYCPEFPGDGIRTSSETDAAVYGNMVRIDEATGTPISVVSGANSYGFGNFDGSELLRYGALSIDLINGLIGIGVQGAPAAALDVDVNGSPRRALRISNSDTIVSPGELISAIEFHQNDGGSDEVRASIKALGALSDGSTELEFCAGTGVDPNKPYLKLWYSGRFSPMQDNQQELGSANYRWSEIFAGTGSINTSDAREKQQIGDLSDAELRVGAKLKVRRFKFNEAVDRKGTSARWHIGFVAQEVIAAFESEGLDPYTYGVVCFDEWTGHPEVMNDEGRVVTPELEAGDRYGIRHDELYALMMAAKCGGGK